LLKHPRLLTDCTDPGHETLRNIAKCATTLTRLGDSHRKKHGSLTHPISPSICGLSPRG